AHFFARCVQLDDPPAAVDVENVIISELDGVKDSVLLGVCVERLAFAVHFDELIVGGEKSVPVRQSLAADRAVIRAILPKNLSFAVAFGDGVPAVLGDEDAAAGQRPGIDGPLHVGDLPALLAVGAALPDSSAAASRAIQLANQRKPEER